MNWPGVAIARRAAWWRHLGPWARISLAGIVAAGLLAVSLGWYIPRQVEREFLAAQVASDQAVLDVLSSTDSLIPATGSDLATLDEFVTQSVLRGDFVRAKLWTLDGTVLYSDEPALIGRSFEPDDEFEEVRLTRQAVSQLSSLDAAENEFEHDLGGELLETYLPVIDDGEVVAIWEVYRSLDGLNGAVRGVRTAVWASVALGLGLLAMFLVTAFGGLVSSVERRRRDAETRSSELTTLLDVARATVATLDPHELAIRTVELLAATDGYDWVRLASIGPDELTVLAEAASVADSDGLWEDAEVATGENTILRLSARRAPDVPPGSAMLATALEEYRIGVERAVLYQDLDKSRLELSKLMERLVVAQEDERQRIVGEVHDGLGQDLHRILLGIRGSQAATEDQIWDELGTLESIVVDAIKKLRRLLQDLHPSTIDDIGLAASIRGLIERMQEDYGLQVDVHLDVPQEPPIPTRTALFRITQEALHNVVKHANTRSADVRITRSNGAIELRVADAGSGIVDDAGSGLGLWLMEERARSAGGTFTIDTGPAGTSVTAKIPVEMP